MRGQFAETLCTYSTTHKIMTLCMRSLLCSALLILRPNSMASHTGEAGPGGGSEGGSRCVGCGEGVGSDGGTRRGRDGGSRGPSPPTLDVTISQCSRHPRSHCVHEVPLSRKGCQENLMLIMLQETRVVAEAEARVQRVQQHRAAGSILLGDPEHP